MSLNSEKMASKTSFINLIRTKGFGSRLMSSKVRLLAQITKASTMKRAAKTKNTGAIKGLGGGRNILFALPAVANALSPIEENIIKLGTI
jgi:hypothetical protein